MCTRTEAAQLGPIFPTHHYPTDKSFHLGYSFSIINSKANFTERLLTDPLDNNTSLKILRNEFVPEFQPNRKLSLGARIVLDTLATASNDGSNRKQTTLGDQALFAEFRVLDEPGSSLGFAMVAKIPSYSNPTLVELQKTSETHTILPGDAQIDASLLVTTEYWAGANLRLRGDLGYMIRLDGYAPELPYNVSIGIVNPKMDFELRLKGNFSLGSGVANDNDSQAIKNAFSNSDYAYSPNPWLMIIEPHVELWLSAKTALSFDYSYSLMGTHAPSYHSVGAGLVYRWAETNGRARKTFKEVSISTDQETGKFEGDTNSDSTNTDTDPVFEE
ncbi:MAG: hypothetical protein ABIR96_04730 [Bdellovibrionota bacterium]